jgi:glutamate synthase (NADPH/NADH) small chain
MGMGTGFLEFERDDRNYEPVEVRDCHWRKFVPPMPEAEVREQAARNLHSTNNFPEVTGRVCLAPCESSCILNIDDNPVAIKTIECAIADRAIESGWIKPEPPSHTTGKKIAVVGSGPAGMACAQQLARPGHDVHVYEKYAKAGGLMRYGIPDFKMEKNVVDVRVKQMEGVTFHYGAHVGGNLPAETLLKEYDAVALTAGAEASRDLLTAGRDLKGIHFAMDFLPQQNRRGSGEPVGPVEPILATGKYVVVIGGGDTGSDCIGTSAFRKIWLVGFWSMMLFLGILTVCFIYEWKKGALEWD